MKIFDNYSHVFVVANGGDRLHYQFAVPDTSSFVVPVVDVFPENTVIDFMHAYDVFELDSFSNAVAAYSIKVLD